MASVRMQALELDISLAIMLRWLLLSSVVDPLRQRASLNNCLVSNRCYICITPTRGFHDHYPTC